MTLGLILFMASSCSKVDSVEVDHTFKSAIDVTQEINEFQKVDFEPLTDLDLGFYEGNVWVQLEVTNKEEYTSYVVMMNDLINRNYRFYKLDSIENTFTPLSFDTDLLINDHRTYNNSKPNFQIDLKPEEKATFIITTTSDGRILQANPSLLSLDEYRTIHSRTSLFNILFYTVIGLLLLINIFHWSILKNKIYYYYGFYILSSCLFYLNVEGLLYGLGVSISAIDHLMFLSIRIWVLAAVLFTSKFLDIRITYPRFFKLIKYMLLIILGGTTIYQFTFFNTSISTLHVIENLFGFIWIIISILMIILSFKARKSLAKYYLTAFSFLLFFITLGLIDSHLTLLPGDPFSFFKIGTIIEFTGFTYFIVVIIRTQLKKTISLENELIQNRKELIDASKKLESRKIKTDFPSVFKMVENSLSTQSEWDEFKAKLEKLSPSFLDKIVEKHPDLSKSELRLLILIRIGYTQKEIAETLSIAPASVKKARSRVRKKLNIPTDIHLKDYLLEVSP